MPYNFNDWGSVYLSKLPNLLWALVVLLIGWIIAKAVGKSVEKLMRKTKVDEKLFHRRRHPAADGEHPAGKKKWDTNEIAGKIVYYILLVFVFMIFFQILNMNAIVSPFMGMFETMFAFIPSVLKAGLILLLAYVIATFLRMLVEKAGQNAKVSGALKKVNVADSEGDVAHYSHTAGNIVFYLVTLLFIPAVLSALNIGGMAEPFRGMLNSMLAFIPKLLAAGLIFAIGWFVAKVIRDLVTGLLRSVGTEKLAGKLGLERALGGTTLSSVIGTIVFVLIMIPITISALDQLQIRAITAPAIAMLDDIMAMIPNIVIAVLLIMVGVWVGKWVRQLVAGLLQRVGFDSLTRNMEIGSWKPGSGKMLLSDLVGYVAQVLVIFFLTIEALNLVKLDFLVTMLTGITAYLPMVLAAVIILALGLIIANIVERILSNILTGPSFKILTAVAKYSIIALAIFMALDQLGVAATIVNSAFILILGGLALAFGLAFGLGGREFASNYLAKLDDTIEKTEVDTSKAPKNPAGGVNPKPGHSPGMGEEAPHPGNVTDVGGEAPHPGHDPRTGGTPQPGAGERPHQPKVEDGGPDTELPPPTK